MLKMVASGKTNLAESNIYFMNSLLEKQQNKDFKKSGNPQQSQSI